MRFSGRAMSADFGRQLVEDLDRGNRQALVRRVRVRDHPAAFVVAGDDDQAPIELVVRSRPSRKDSGRSPIWGRLRFRFFRAPRRPSSISLKMEMREMAPERM